MPTYRREIYKNEFQHFTKSITRARTTRNVIMSNKRNNHKINIYAEKLRQDMISIHQDKGYKMKE